MAGSLRETFLVLGALLFVCGCSTGAGEGSATGAVWAPDCELDGEPFDLEPNFFAMDASSSIDIVDIRVQRGSDSSILSDGITISIDEAESFQQDLVGVDIELSLFSQVQLTLYLNETCREISEVPVVYRAVSGVVRFDRLYVPGADYNDGTETIGLFSDVRFVDTSEPDSRHATLSGSFDFLYSSGRPAQPFSP